MVTEFQIGKLYIVNNPFNKDGVTNNSFNYVPNGTIMPLLDIQPEYIDREKPEEGRFVYTFWHENKFWKCGTYWFDFINYFDEIIEEKDNV